MNEHPIAVEFELTPEQIAKFGNLGRLDRMDGGLVLRLAVVPCQAG
jgi:hypothetical protein